MTFCKVQEYIRFFLFILQYWIELTQDIASHFKMSSHEGIPKTDDNVSETLSQKVQFKRYRYQFIIEIYLLEILSQDQSYGTIKNLT